jgi:acyl-CoA thioester hydrolase
MEDTMFEFKLLPRLSETDAIGHINNTVLPAWFEEARRDLFKIFIPDLSMQTWNLILRKYEIEIENQISHKDVVTVHTHVSKIGTKSFTVFQEAFQNGVRAATAASVIVYFDYSKNATAEIPEDIKDQLNAHLYQKP